MKKVKISKKGRPIKNKKGYMLAVVLKANRSSKLKWIPLNKDNFSVDSQTYFIDPKGSYVGNPTGVLSAVYLEGSSLPIHHGCMKYIDVPEKIKEWVNPLTGKEETRTVKAHTEIDTVKYDSGLIDMLLNRHLSDAFTKVHLDMPNLVLTVLLIVTVAVGFVNIGMWFK